MYTVGTVLNTQFYIYSQVKKNIKSGACCEDAGTVTSVSQIISLCMVDEGLK